MIKLTVSLESQQQVHIFDKGVVTIGSAFPLEADLSLPLEDLQPVHVKIMEAEGRFVTINQANDPFVTLNGAPFAKRTIKNGDILQIGRTYVAFEGTAAQAPRVNLEPRRESWIQSEEQLQNVLEKALSAKENQRVNPTSLRQHQPDIFGEIDIEKELLHLEELGLKEEWAQEFENDSGIEALLKQLESAKTAPPIAAQPQKAPRASLKDYDLNDFDEVQEIKKVEKSVEEVGWNWKLITSLVSTLILLALLLALFFYFSMKAKNREEELRVAEGLSDISMALTYAQFNHIQPRNQNWTDPEFLKNNLISVLASEYSPITSLDMHGLFNNSNYILRIYNSSDLSHYLIIAQPAPSLSQWVLPRAAIVVDSHDMELRKLTDLKTLNRLMLNPNPLDGYGTNEVSQLIKQGELMPLSLLAAKVHKQGFNPPKALALLRPGAENLIYNAPRYYRFGEQFLKKVMSAAAVGNGDEIGDLQQHMALFSQYPDIVLYASQGMQWTVRAQKMLNTLLPNNKLLLAYLKLNSSGYVASSHLLMDEGSSAATLNETVALEETSTVDRIDEKAGVYSNFEPPKVEVVEETTSSPSHQNLSQELQNLTLAQQEEQKGIEKELVSLLTNPERSEALLVIARMEQLLKKHHDQYLDQPKKLRKQQAAVQFLEQLQQLIARYDALQRDQRDDRVATLTRLYQENAEMPFDEFMEYVTAAGL